MPSDPHVPVPIGACLCPGAPHEDGDVVYLAAKLGLKGGIAVTRVVQDCIGMTEAEIAGTLTETYLLQGIVAWTLEDEDGPVPINRATITAHLLNDFTRSEAAADQADRLYSPVIVLPFLKKLENSLPGMSSNGSTSPTPTGSPKRLKRSKRSSTTTTPTDDTEPISASPAGVSSS